MAASYVLGAEDFTSVGNPDFPDDYHTFQPVGISYDSTNSRLFVSDDKYINIIEFDLSGGVSNGMAASHLFGGSDYLAYGPGDMVYAGDTNSLYVADAADNRVLMYDFSGGVSDGMSASHILGQSDFSGTAAGTSQTTMDFPLAVGYDSSNHRLFVGDFRNNRVLVYDLSSGISDGMPASHVLGQSDFSSSNFFDPATSSGFNGVTGIIYDNLNNSLFVADNSNNRVLLFSLNTLSNGMAASGVLGQSIGGQPSFISNIADNANAKASGLFMPTGTVIDSVHHRLFAGDTGNGRVVVYQLDNNNDVSSANAAYELGET